MDLNKYKKSKLEVDRERHELNGVEKYIREDVMKSYFDVLEYQKTDELLNDVEKSLEKQRDRVAYLYSKNKLVSKNEVLRIDADLMQNKITILKNTQKL